MSKLGGLINGQDVAFDTHQSGDGQDTHWRDVHLEKRLHGGQGKARFPLLGDQEPSKSASMGKGDFDRVKKEVRKALKKNKELVDDLAKTVADELKRFSNGKATTHDAQNAARKLAGYFDLDDNFVREVEERMSGRLIEYTTVHLSPERQTFHEISQSGKRVVIRKAKKNYW